MNRRKVADFPQELLDLFDCYVHGGISRRQFVDGAPSSSSAVCLPQRRKATEASRAIWSAGAVRKRRHHVPIRLLKRSLRDPALAPV
jgi:hypothetical protein